MEANAKPLDRLYALVANEEDARACAEISDDACRVVPGNFFLTMGTLVLTKIGDLLVYDTAPELYDALPVHDWDFAVVHDLVDLADKVVIDAGAGSGKVAFGAEPRARHVFAVEPVARHSEGVERSPGCRLDR